MGDDENLREQRNRVERLVEEITPHGRVDFDPQTPNRIMFRIVDQNTGAILASSGVFHLDELTNKTDDWVRHYIRNLGGGDI